MTVEIYRGYVDPYDAPEDHQFSIISTESGAKYAVPDAIAESLGLDDARIAMIVNSYKVQGVPVPTTPLEWARLASDNMSQIDVVLFEPTEPYSDDEIDMAIEDEKTEATDALEIRNENKSVEPITAAVSDACPPATQDISINLANREKAIKDAAYGPLNPAEPNEEFWQEKSTRWSITPDEAKKSLCGNCVMFITTTKMKDCIAQGIEQGGSSEDNAWDAVDAAELGYCEAFDFKCAASRTCNAWVAGGPIDDSKAKE